MKMELFQKILMQIIADHFRRYAHALRFAIGLHGAWKFHRIVENKHYQISSGARASLTNIHVLHRDRLYSHVSDINIYSDI